MAIEIPWLDLRSAVENEPKPLDFVFPGFKSGAVGALVSPGGTGKTMLALQVAVTVATGADLLNLADMDSAWRLVTWSSGIFNRRRPSRRVIWAFPRYRSTP
ncbi:AAA family ATPase [Vibrio alginolyticus]